MQIGKLHLIKQLILRRVNIHLVLMVEQTKILWHGEQIHLEDEVKFGKQEIMMHHLMQTVVGLNQSKD